MSENEAPKVVSGHCRNNGRALSHTYAMMDDGDLLPMCGYGWNRSGGEGFSIWRGSPGTEGACAVCRNNVAMGKAPIADGFSHKTKWL